MDDAQQFLDLGMRELREGRSKGEQVRVREASEKIFHALVEACVALIQKYGLDPPREYASIRVGLDTKGETDLRKLFDRAYATLHVLVYNRSWLDYDEIDRVVGEVSEAVARIEKSSRR
ncbi:MAG: hypothetical protein WB778_00410 [Thermoplasmata archaeon]